MKRIAHKLLLLTISTAFTGCSSMCDHVIECEISVRNHIIAQKAWNEWSWCYDELDHPFHFAKGFKAGYEDILDGGKGCQPTLPPKCYWKPTYQGPEGVCKVNAWFNGYSHGALAARQDGYGSLSQIPISPTARMNFETACAPPQADAFSGMDPVAQPASTLPDASVTDPGLPGIPGLDYGTDGGMTDDQAVPLRPYE